MQEFLDDDMIASAARFAIVCVVLCMGVGGMAHANGISPVAAARAFAKDDVAAVERAIGRTGAKTIVFLKGDEKFPDEVDFVAPGVAVSAAMRLLAIYLPYSDNGSGIEAGGEIALVSLDDHKQKAIFSVAPTWGRGPRDEAHEPAVVARGHAKWAAINRWLTVAGFVLPPVAHANCEQDDGYSHSCVELPAQHLQIEWISSHGHSGGMNYALHSLKR